MKFFSILITFVFFNLTGFSNEVPLTRGAYSNSGDHLIIFSKFLDKQPIEKFVEFGLGGSTRYFIKRCTFVRSIEILYKPMKTAWYDNCKKSFSEYTNWDPHLVWVSQKFRKAHKLSIKGINPLTKINYLPEITTFLDKFVDYNKFDLAFVDHGFYNRADFVNGLFNRVDIIVAHDTNYKPSKYGWYRIKTPEDYVCYHYNTGMGTTFWIRKKRVDVIETMEKLAEELNSEKTVIQKR